MQDIRRDMEEMRREGLLWREIAARYGVTAGMAWRVCNEGYMPKDRLIREKLGLKKKKFKDLVEIDPVTLKRMIEEREEME